MGSGWWTSARPTSTRASRTRPIAGEPPRLPQGQDPAGWARRIADALDDAACTEVGSGA